MKYLIEYSSRREVYEVYDMTQQPCKGAEKLRLCVFSKEEMDVVIDYILATSKFTKMSLEFN